MFSNFLKLYSFSACNTYTSNELQPLSSAACMYSLMQDFYEHNLFLIEMLKCSTHEIHMIIRQHMVFSSIQDAAIKMWIADQKQTNVLRSLETLGHIVELAVPVYVRHDPAKTVTYRWLHSIAQLRFVLALFADMLNTHVADTPEKLPLTHRESKMLEELIEYLSTVLLRDTFQDLSLYLAKHLARRHSMKILRCLYNQGHRFVLPRALHQQVMCIRKVVTAYSHKFVHNSHKICSIHWC